MSADLLQANAEEKPDQAARHGPSMSPGCTEAAYKVVEPYLKKWAVKTKQGEPCVMRIGPGGSGHCESRHLKASLMPDVKMIHNGIGKTRP